MGELLAATRVVVNGNFVVVDDHRSIISDNKSGR
jgi:hypothetical protein